MYVCMYVCMNAQVIQVIRHLIMILLLEAACFAHLATLYGEPQVSTISTATSHPMSKAHI